MSRDQVASLRAVRAFCAVAVTSAVMLSCDRSTAPQGGHAASIVLSSAATVGLRAHHDLAPVVLDSAGKIISRPTDITWSSSNAAFATVDDSGVVYGVALGGPVTITASIGDVSATSTFSVVPADVVITPVLHGMTLNGTQQMSAEARDFLGAQIDAGSVAWSSSDPTIASIDPATGVLSGIALGNAIISATVGGRTSGLGIFVGAVSSLDGVYSSFGSNDPVSLRVFLGRVTDFSAVVHISGCVATIAAQPDAIIANASDPAATHAMSFPTADGQATVQGSFHSDGTVTGSFTGSVFNVPTTCLTGANPSQQATRTFSAAR